VKTELLILSTTLSPPPVKDGHKTRPWGFLALMPMDDVNCLCHFMVLFCRTWKIWLVVESNKIRKRTPCRVFFRNFLGSFFLGKIWTGKIWTRLNGRNVFGCYGRIICELFVKIIIGHLEQILVMGRWNCYVLINPRAEFHRLFRGYLRKGCVQSS